MQKNFSGSQQDNDTIAALCTAPGGALAIIRISGPEALSAASKVWRGRQPLSAETARIMHLGKACPQADGASGEPCLAVYMKGPRSYTGEDTVELQCHGGAFAPKRLLNAVLAAGARLAGETIADYWQQLKLIFQPKTKMYEELGGFIAIGNIFPAEWDWLRFWNMTAFLSIMLAVLNILPIPALDGGHALFTLWEMLTGRKPSDKFLEVMQYIGFFLLLALVIYANGNDIYRLLGK